MNSEKNTKSLIICGLPESGKTTFLAALAHIICSEDIDSQLKFNGIAKDRAYLNQLEKKWLACQSMERTLLGQHSTLELNLKSERDEFTLSIPDLSGETWGNFWQERNCPQEVADIINEASGVMLFVHCDIYKRVLSIADLNLQCKTKQLDNPGIVEEWDPIKHTPTQTILVDILQSISSLSVSEGKKDLIIVLSAWDKAVSSGDTPSQYLESNFSILNQYLKSGFDYDSIKVIGVSAQGGDFKTDLDKLASIDIPSQRILVTEENTTSHDLTQPLCWLLEH